MSFFDHDYKSYPELSNSQLSTIGFSSPHVQITESFDAEVVKVHDGDTITVRVGFRDFVFPIRFLDINAPEMSEGGLEAREWLNSRLLGEVVHVVIDASNRVGKYGRLLGRIVHSGLDVGLEMLNLGLVKTFGSDVGVIPKLDKLFRLNQWF